MFCATPADVSAREGNGCTLSVHRIYCVGQNYADHAIELGGDPTRNPPFFFQKTRIAL